MNYLKRHLTAVTAIFLGVVVAVLYGSVLSHLLIYMEQHRLFRFSHEYIAAELHQEGAAKLAGTFVAQFFNHPGLGAMILGVLFALLFAMVADGLRRLAGRAGILTIVCGLILPAILLAQGGTIEAPIEPLMLSLGGGCVFWVVCTVAALILRRKRREPSGAVLPLAAGVLIIGGAVVWNLTKSYDPMERTVVLIEEEYRAGDDEAVVRRADEYLASGGRVHVVPFFRNLSLLRSGRLATNFLDYPPLFGVRALYVPWDGHVLKREYGVYLYDLIGHVNEA